LDPPSLALLFILFFLRCEVITYKKRLLKYELAETYDIETGIFPSHLQPLRTRFMTLMGNGRLQILKGYAWDGPSGPTIDTATFMRGSLIHDCFYQLLRENHLPQDFRIKADKLLRKMCREDGMNRFRAWVVYRSVRMFGGSSARPPKTSSNLFTAPK